MDNNTQNPQPPVDATQAPAMPAPTPADPMANATVPDLPTAPMMPDPDPAPVAAAGDPMSSMQQMAATQPAQPIPGVDAPPPVVMPEADSMPVADSTATTPAMPAQQDASSLGPVTMEDLMEELQHIEDKLDEMDEKL